MGDQNARTVVGARSQKWSVFRLADAEWWIQQLLQEAEGSGCAHGQHSSRSVFSSHAVASGVSACDSAPPPSRVGAGTLALSIPRRCRHVEKLGSRLSSSDL